MVAAVVLLFLISISTIVRLYTDLQWYREVRFTSVFWTILRSEVLLGLGLGIVFFLFCLANLFIVARLMPVYRLAVDPNDPLNRYRTGPTFVSGPSTGCGSNGASTEGAPVVA